MSSSMSWGLDAAKTGGQLFQSTELNTKGKQDKFLSFHQLLSTLEWRKLVTHLPDIKPLVTPTPLAAFIGAWKYITK